MLHVAMASLSMPIYWPVKIELGAKDLDYGYQMAFVAGWSRITCAQQTLY